MDIAFVHWLVILSAMISIAGASAYVIDTLKGTTKPNRITFFLWAAAPLFGGAAAISAGADLWATVRVFVSGLIPLIIFFASFVNPQSYWKLTLFDYFCGAFAVFALCLWWLADSPVLAILFLAIADGFALLPTLFKAWKYPETETAITYVAGLVAVVIVLPSIPVWNIENSAFQIYLLIANIALVFCVYRKRVFG